ncbi:MAG: protein kinase [Acidobacteria bacterium]|nr:protein kinase [Acidobacteriota bacterium]
MSTLGKICPTCKQTFAATINFCPADSEVLEFDLNSLVGTLLDGQYQVEELLGKGGMGAVYRARHSRLGDMVAIKILPLHLSGNPEYQRRFVREGQAARLFRHPNAVAVFDLRETSDGLLYMVQEYVKGQTLTKELKKRRALPATEAFYLLEPIMGALQAAHQSGVVHRDLKPDNIMIGTDADGKPMVKLLDLGIAKIRESADVTALTMTGQLLGTPFYMSPEQWDGTEDIDGRSDIYSLAIILYELISGKRPFEGKTLESLAYLHTFTKAKPLHELRSGIPYNFSRIIERAMEKDRNLRPPTMLAFMEQLRQAILELNIGIGGPVTDEQEAALTLFVHTDAQPTNPGQDTRQKGATKTLLDVAENSQSDQLRETAGTPDAQVTMLDPTPSQAQKMVPPPDFSTTRAPIRKDPPKKAISTSKPLAAPALTAPTLKLDPETSDPSPVQQVFIAESPQLDSANVIGALVEKPAISESRFTMNQVLVAMVAGIMMVIVAGVIFWPRTNIPRSTPPVPIKTTPVLTEVLQFWITVSQKTGSATTEQFANEPELQSGTEFKFGFQSSEFGYLYILGPGKNNQLMTFLTNVQSLGEPGHVNVLPGGKDYIFPEKEHFWIKLDNQPGVETYTLIFSPVQLEVPTFWNREPGSILTPEEMQEWQALQIFLVKAETKIISQPGPRLLVLKPKDQNQKKPVVFEVKINHKSTGSALKGRA